MKNKTYRVNFLNLFSAFVCVMFALSGTAYSSYDFAENGEASEAIAGYPSVSAVSAIVMEMNTGTVLYEKNAYEERAMASTTKIMSALITLESGGLDERFTVDPYAIMVEGSSMGLMEGDIVTKRILSYGMLLPSGNDAANAAAIAVAGSIQSFADMMNRKAKQIGMKNSRFVTPSGLDADGHYTTAYDMALLTSVALQNQDFAEICALPNAQLEFGNPPYTRWLKNSNKLLSQYEGCIGVKTGFTDNARRCLVSAARRDGVTLIAVTLNAPNDWQDHKTMLDYGFSQTEKITLIPEIAEIKIPVVGGHSDTVRIIPAEFCEVSVVSNQIQDIKTTLYLPEFLYAPTTAGDIAGYASFTINGAEIGRVIINVADNTERKIIVKKSFFEKIAEFFGGLF